MIGLGIGGSRLKPLFLIVGFILGFSIVGLPVLSSGNFLGLENLFIRLIAGNIILFAGLSRLIRQTFSKHRHTDACKTTPKLGWHKPGLHIFRGLIAGLALGAVWTPCAGPVLMTAMTVSSIPGWTALATSLLFAVYALGVVIPILLIIFVLGQYLSKMCESEKPAQAVFFFFGICTVAVGFLFIVGLDLAVQAYLFPVLPFSFLAI